jgi:hypothetical protein
MSHEHKEAIEKIIRLCENCRQPTQRILGIYDICLKASGMTANQREFKLRALSEEKWQEIRNKQEKQAARSALRAANREQQEQQQHN